MSVKILSVYFKNRHDKLELQSEDDFIDMVQALGFYLFIGVVNVHMAGGVGAYNSLNSDTLPKQAERLEVKKNIEQAHAEIVSVLTRALFDAKPVNFAKSLLNIGRNRDDELICQLRLVYRENAHETAVQNAVKTAVDILFDRGMTRIITLDDNAKAIPERVNIETIA